MAGIRVRNPTHLREVARDYDFVNLFKDQQSRDLTLKEFVWLFYILLDIQILV